MVFLADVAMVLLQDEKIIYSDKSGCLDKVP
jgi:hypothetical protein